jgi:diguanylate cyclase (GGDEF)-like protein
VDLLLRSQTRLLLYAIRLLLCALALSPALLAQMPVDPAGRLLASTPVATSLPAKADWASTQGTERSQWIIGFCELVLLQALILGVFERLRFGNLQRNNRQLKALVEQRTQELEAAREQLSLQANQLQEQALQWQLQTNNDPLTGLLSRSGILAALDSEIERAMRERRPMALVLAQLDYVEQFDQNIAEGARDAALRRFAAALRSAARSYDHAGRYGEAEFLLILSNMTRETTQRRLASFHGSLTRLKVVFGQFEFGVTCSMGATLCDPVRAPGSVEALLGMADQALRQARQEGRNRVVFREPELRPARRAPEPAEAEAELPAAAGSQPEEPAESS